MRRKVSESEQVRAGGAASFGQVAQLAQVDSDTRLRPRKPQPMAATKKRLRLRRRTIISGRARARLHERGSEAHYRAMVEKCHFGCAHLLLPTTGHLFAVGCELRTKVPIELRLRVRRIRLANPSAAHLLRAPKRVARETQMRRFACFAWPTLAHSRPSADETQQVPR